MTVMVISNSWNMCDTHTENLSKFGLMYQTTFWPYDTRIHAISANMVLNKVTSVSPGQLCRKREHRLFETSLGVEGVTITATEIQISRCKCKQDSVGVRWIQAVPRDSGGASTRFCWCILSGNRSGYLYSCFFFCVMTDGLSMVCSW